MVTAADIESIARSLGGGKESKTSTGWKTLCPAHVDSQPSLVISLGAGGKMLCKCHSGCTFDQVKDALKDQKLLPDTERKKSDKAKKQDTVTVLIPVPEHAPDPQTIVNRKFGKPTKVWEYRNIYNELIFCCARFDYVDEEGKRKKEMFPYCYVKDDKGNEYWKPKGAPYDKVKLTLYNAHLLPLRPDDPVVMVEGEKCADYGNKHFGDKFIFMCWSGGGNGFAKSDFTVLNGRTVIMWPDADDPGMKAMINLGALLTQEPGTITNDVRLVTLPQGLPRGWDIADEIPGGIQLDIFERIISAQKYVNPTEEIISIFNKKYAVMVEQGNVSVVQFDKDGNLLDGAFKKTAFFDAIKEYADVVVDKKEIPAPEYWFNHPDRRQYDGYCFDTEKGRDVETEDGLFLNRWAGYMYTATERGDWSILRDHIYRNLARDNEDHGNWIIAWFAHLMKYPRGRPNKKVPGTFRRLGTAMAVIGDQGTGKSVVGEHMGKLLGKHYLSTSDEHTIFTNFNFHLRDVVLLQADEAIFTGNKKIANRLKGLVTGEELQIENKGFNIITCPNMVHMYMTSNDDHVINASGNERRYGVFLVSQENQRDHAFFQAMEDELLAGGYERLLYDLLNFDFSIADPAKVPETEALRTQKAMSLSPFNSFLQSLLLNGRYDDVSLNGGGEVYTIYELYQAYLKYVKDRGDRFPDDISTFQIKMQDVLQHRTSVVRKPRGLSLKFDDLRSCRIAFCNKLGLDIDWYDDPLLIEHDRQERTREPKAEEEIPF